MTRLPDTADIDATRQNLRDEVAMDVDEDEEGSQHIKRVSDYGIDVDFSSLEEEDMEVRSCSSS